MNKILSFFLNIFTNNNNQESQGKIINIDDTDFKITHDVKNLCKIIKQDNRGVLVIKIQEYSEKLGDLSSRLAKDFGDNSPQFRQRTGSLFLCAGCRWEFPGSYIMSLTFGNNISIAGATSGYKEFKNQGCPQCGSDEMLVVYEYFPSETVTELDVRALKNYWKAQALTWWGEQTISVVQCTKCDNEIQRGQGYFRGVRSISGLNINCENCVDDLLKDGLKNLKDNPNYYFGHHIRKLRKYRS